MNAPQKVHGLALLYTPCTHQLLQIMNYSGQKKKLSIPKQEFPQNDEKVKSGIHWYKKIFGPIQ